MEKQIYSRPNYHVVRQLMKVHGQLSDFVSDMELRGVKLFALSGIDLFKIVLDVIGFPPGEDDPRDDVGNKGGTSSLTYDREKWGGDHCFLKGKEIDQFLERLYADYDEFLLTQQEPASGKK